MVTDFRHVEEQARNRVVSYATPPSVVRDTAPVSHATPYESVKESVEGKTYPEWAPSPSALGASINEKEKRAFRKEEFVSDSTPQTESPELDRATITPEGLKAVDKFSVIFWTEKKRDWEAALEVCRDPKQRSELEEKLVSSDTVLTRSSVARNVGRLAQVLARSLESLENQGAAPDNRSGDGGRDLRLGVGAPVGSSRIGPI